VTGSSSEGSSSAPLVGHRNAAEVTVNGNTCLALLDSGSQVSTMSKAFWQQLVDTPLQPLSLLNVYGMGGQVPYLGYVDVDVLLPQGCKTIAAPFLVLEDADSVSNECLQVPLLIGTNILKIEHDEMIKEHGVGYLQKVKLDPALRLALRSLVIQEKNLRRKQGNIGKVKALEAVQLQPGESVVVFGSFQSDISINNIIAVAEAPAGSSFDVIPGLVKFDKTVPVEVCNTQSYPVRIQVGQVIGSLYTGVIEDPQTLQCFEPEFLQVLKLHHLDDLLEPNKKEEFLEFLQTWENLFSISDTDIGHTSVVKHNIHLTDETPFKEKPRRIPPSLHEELRQHLKGLQKSGSIRPSSSPWSSEVVIVRKSSGQIRLCVDYRRLNSVTKKDAYAIPRIDEILDQLGGSKYFTLLDLRSGYHQVEVEETDKEKTAFRVGPLGFYEWNRMPFGLTNAPATFQRLMEIVLKGIHWKYCIVYLDDIIVFSNTLEEHVERLNLVFSKLEKAGLKLNAEKCRFLETKVKYLGHIVSNKGIEVDGGYVKDVLNYPVPRDVADLRRFLGLSGFYRKFQQNYAKIAQPLTSLLQGINPRKSGKASKEKTPWVWGPAQETAFNNLKQLLVQAPVLAFPNYDLPFILRTDASLQGLGAVLCQEQDGMVKVVGYGSRALKPSEKHYSTYKLEFLALYWAVTKKFHDYLYGNNFMVTTDHNPLTYILTSAKLDATGHRWVAELANYNFKIEYKPGRNNMDADALSRIPHLDDISKINEEMVGAICVAYTEADICVAELLCASANVVPDPIVPFKSELPNINVAEEQDKDMDIHFVKMFVKKKCPPEPEQFKDMTPFCKKLLRNFDSLHLQDDILYRSTGISNFRLILPTRLKEMVFQMLHDDMGHPGRDKTVELYKSRFYWPGMVSEIEASVKSCSRCTMTKRPYLPDHAPLEPIITTQPLELVCVDFLTLEESVGGYSNILVITDHFTKYSQAYPTRNQSAVTTAKLLYDNFIVHYGLPQTIHSDQGRNFESKIIAALCKILNIQKSRTTPYHPMGNGCVERMNRTLLSMMRTLTEEKKRNWKDSLPSLIYAYNCTKHDTTGFSPYFLMFGRHPRLPVDILLGLPDESDCEDYPQFVNKLKDRLEHTFGLVKEAIAKSADKQKSYQPTIRGVVPEIGDLVLVRNVGLKGKHKLADRWQSDVFKIVGKPNPGIPVYQIQLQNGKGKVRTVHRNLLLPLTHPLSELRDHSVPCRSKKTNHDKSQRKDMEEILSSSESEEDVVYPSHNDQQRRVDRRQPDRKVDTSERDMLEQEDASIHIDDRIPTSCINDEEQGNQMESASKNPEIDKVEHEINPAATEESFIARPSIHEEDKNMVQDEQPIGDDILGFQNPAKDHELDTKMPFRRSTRTRKTPGWYGDYIVGHISAEWERKVLFLVRLMEDFPSQESVICKRILEIMS
jgi:transposase InsO family protein